MPDQSHLDKRYFITGDTFNCPYCRRGSVGFRVGAGDKIEFDWSDSKEVMGFIATCASCGKRSLHLTFNTALIGGGFSYPSYKFAPKYAKVIDEELFFSQPSSFFTIDQRIPRNIRDLIAEARECRHANFLVGASACLRKAIYELLAHEGVPKTESDGQGGSRERHYGDRVNDLKARQSHMDPTSFDILSDALTTTSDQLHEDSWQGWTAKEFDAVLAATLSVLEEMYVLPDERKKRAAESSALVAKMRARPALAEAKAEEKPSETR